MPLKDIEARHRQLAVLLDKQAIYEVLLNIARGLDRYDRALLAAAILPDAALDMGGAQPMTGAAFVAAIKAPAVPPAGRMHLIGNHSIEVDGDVARSESYVISCQEIGEGEMRHTRVKAGRYLDCFERRTEGWRLSSRTFVDEWARTDIVGQAPEKGRHRGRPAPYDVLYLQSERAGG